MATWYAHAILDDCRGVFAARTAYDLLISDGTFGIGKRKDIVHFLDANRIVTLRELDYSGLATIAYGRPVNVFSLCGTDRRAMGVAGLRFSNGNSLLLMLSVGGLVKVLDC